jgi:hypothetical protein
MQRYRVIFNDVLQTWDNYEASTRVRRQVSLAFIKAAVSVFPEFTDRDSISALERALAQSAPELDKKEVAEDEREEAIEEEEVDDGQNFLRMASTVSDGKSMQENVLVESESNMLRDVVVIEEDEKEDERDGDREYLERQETTYKRSSDNEFYEKQHDALVTAFENNARIANMKKQSRKSERILSSINVEGIPREQSSSSDGQSMTDFLTSCRLPSIFTRHFR